MLVTFSMAASQDGIKKEEYTMYLTSNEKVAKLFFYKKN